MTQWFPVKGFQEVTYTDLGLPENSQVLELDTSLPPFDKFYTVNEIFQDKDAKKHLTFYRR
jgi:hypothetical protein